MNYNTGLTYDGSGSILDEILQPGVTVGDALISMLAVSDTIPTEFDNIDNKVSKTLTKPQFIALS